jgi:hypothetical protein
MNTLVSPPARRPGAMPACSSASQATSSATRCCGSISSASRGEMPKNSASNPATSSRKPPDLIALPTASAKEGPFAA